MVHLLYLAKMYQTKIFKEKLSYFYFNKYSIFILRFDDFFYYKEKNNLIRPILLMKQNTI